MNRGKLIALDTPARLREGLREPLLEARTSNGTRTIEALAGAPRVGQAGLFGRAVHISLKGGDDADRDRARLAELLAGRGIEVESIERIEPSLEDVFIALVEKTGGAVVD
jgi:ABC-2 type transport system ATP-binding protein